jgi:putative endonuclease
MAKPKTSYTTGLSAEFLCRIALRLKLYRILASRYRSPLGEIDIIASRGKIVALIEVKARATQGAALESISMKQRERLQRAAQDFLARYPSFNSYNLRFDAMLVAPRKWPQHIKDAWRPDRAP